MKAIERFRGVHAFLSNFYAAPVGFEGLLYPTVEHAYQAAKSLDVAIRRGIRDLSTATNAKMRGRAIRPLRTDWEQVKFDVMLTCLRSKFLNPELRAQLVATGDARLVESNTWGDRVWGVCDGRGENHLGRLLMQVRTELA